MASLIHSFVWDSDTAVYDAFSTTCPNVKNGTGCGQNMPASGYSTTVQRSDGAGPFGSGIIFSWGTATGADATLNSTLTWTNDGAPITLDHIRLIADGSVGTGLSTPSGRSHPVGHGAAPPWEWANSAQDTCVNEATAKVTVGSSVRDIQIFTGFAEEATWFDFPGETLQTLIDITVDYSGDTVTVGTGETIEIRLWDQYWDGRGATLQEGRPDLIYAPITVEIHGTSSAPPPPVDPIPPTCPEVRRPVMLPLVNSFARNDVDAQSKQHFIDLFYDLQSVDFWDAMVLGSAHLGTFNLIRRSVNADGLSLLQDSVNLCAARYLYRAWKSQNNQGRGLHFLRTYLQMLFPGRWEIYQLWHQCSVSVPHMLGEHHLMLDGTWMLRRKDACKTYPYYTLRPRPQYSMQYHYLGDDGLLLDGTWCLGQDDYMPDPSLGPGEYSYHHLYLTNRIEVTILHDVDMLDFRSIARTLSACLPARMVLVIGLWRERILAQPNSIDYWALGPASGNLGEPVFVTASQW